MILYSLSERSSRDQPCDLEMARILGNDYDMEILEVHLRRKKDAPSGTATRLAQILADASDRDLEKVGVYERKGMIGERSDDEIGIQTAELSKLIQRRYKQPALKEKDKDIWKKKLMMYQDQAAAIVKTLETYVVDLRNSLKNPSRNWN